MTRGSEGDMLRLWDATVGCSAMLVIILIAMGMMVQLVEVGDGLKRILTALACAALLIILPTIIVSIWLRLALWQQIGICGVCGLLLTALVQCQRKKGTSHRVLQ